MGFLILLPRNNKGQFIPNAKGKSDYIVKKI